MADSWEEAAKQFKPDPNAPATPAASGGGEDWKLYQQGAPASGGTNVPLGDQPATFGGVARTMGTQAVEGLKGAAKGLGRSVYNAATAPFNPLGNNPIANALEKRTHLGETIRSATEPSNTAQTIGNYLPDVAMTVMGGAGELPNAARAGSRIGAIRTALKDVPVNIDAAAEPALRAEQLARAKFSRPAVMKEVLNRLSPGAAPTTFKESTDLGMNLGELSASERAMLKRPMGGTIKQTAKAIGEANQATAQAAGMGDAYKQAMREYKVAKTLGNAKDAAIKIATKYALPGAATGAGLAAGYKAAKGLGYLGD